MRADFVLDALAQALYARQPERESSLIHHCDRGSQYVSVRYSERLAEAGIEPSVGSKGDSYDNALSETINGIYKAEFIHRRRPGSRHRNVTFASMADEEARSLFDLGFRPGTPQSELWRTFWRTLRAPQFSCPCGPHAVAPELRQGAACARRRGMGVLGRGAVRRCNIGMAVAAVSGRARAILIGGNIGSFLELASRHRWLVTPEEGARRQFVLSQGRFPAPAPQERGAGIRLNVGWWVDVFLASMGRLMVVPGDLNWHIAHHFGLVPALRHGQPPWTDAASAYSIRFWNNEPLKCQSHRAILDAVGASFAALEAEPPVDP